MARELQIDVIMNSAEAAQALLDLQAKFRAAGDTAEQASAKVEKFEKAYREGAARKQAKAEIDALAAATKNAGNEAEKASDKTIKQAGATDALRSAVLRYASAAVVGAAIKSTLDWAGNLSDLSKATGISTTALQKFEIIGKANGVTLNEISNAALQMANRLAGGDKSAAAAARALGLDIGRLVASKPDEALLSIARALAGVENPQKRVALGMDLLGRSGANLLPVLDDLNSKWDKTKAKLGEEGVAALDEAGDKIDELTDAGKSLIANFLAPFAPILGAIASALGPVAALFSAFMRDILSPLDINKWREWKDTIVDAARAMQFIVGAGPGISAPLPGMPGAPTNPFLQGSGLGSTAPAPGSSQFRLAEAELTAQARNSILAGRGAGAGPGFTAPSLAGGMAASSLFMFANQPGGLGNFRLPMSIGRAPLAAGGSPLSFLNGMQLPGTVPMNAPGGGGGLSSFLQGRGGAMAGAGLSFLTNMFGSRLGLSQTGSSIGSLVGSFIPGLGPIGGALGGIAGGLLGRLFGGGQNRAEQRQVTQMRSGAEFDAMIAKARELGISVSDVFSARRVEDFQRAVSRVTGEISRQEQEHEKVIAAMERYGLTIEDMGEKWKQSEMNKMALQMAEDFVTLVNAGADANKVLEKMAPTLSEFLQKSKIMGTEVPREMKPVLDAAQKAGLLFDENGQKLTDEAYANIRWAETMTQGFDRVVASIERLIAAISGVGDEFDRTRQSADDFADSAERAGEGWWNGGGGSETPGFATGGVAGRDFRRPGHGDVFPALLRRGERVLPPGAGGGMSLTINGLSVGSFGSRGDAVEEIGESVVRYLERRGARLVA